MFTYRLKGFKDQPTDHYPNNYYVKAESFETFPYLCAGSEPMYKSWFRYTKDFMREYASVPKFGLMHLARYSHDDINLVEVVDDEFSSFLRFLRDSGHLRNTLLIVMADHGHRFAQLRNTHQGQLEERLPFMSLLPPTNLHTRSLVIGNLKKNVDRLTSPFDLHATLMDALYWPSDLTTEQDASSRSLSLLSPIPSNRSCPQAGIAPHWCTCLDWRDAMRDQRDKKLSYQLAEAVVTAINRETEKERKLCAPLALKELQYAKKLVPKQDLLAYKNVQDQDGFVPDLTGRTEAAFATYQLKLSTKPGRAVYEVTLSYDMVERKATVDLAAISHVSQYGDDPHCIIDKGDASNAFL